MEKSLTLSPVELNATLLEALRKYVKASNATEITISFKTPNRASRLRNETQEETNKRIEDAVKYFEEGNEGIIFTGDEFNELSNALLKMK
jgi:hypothetical protein